MDVGVPVVPSEVALAEVVRPAMSTMPAMSIPATWVEALSVTELAPTFTESVALMLPTSTGLALLEDGTELELPSWSRARSDSVPVASPPPSEASESALKMLGCTGVALEGDTPKEALLP